MRDKLGHAKITALGKTFAILFMISTLTSSCDLIKKDEDSNEGDAGATVGATSAGTPESEGEGEGSSILQAYAAVSLSSPYSSRASSNSLTVSGTCVDGTTVSIGGDIDNAPIEITCSGGAYSSSVSLSGADGAKNIEVTQVDPNGDSTSATVSVFKRACALESGFVGDGTFGVPYQVCSLEQLDRIRDDLSSVYQLMYDIDAAPTQYWNSNTGMVPIGDATTPFSGELRGNGMTISNLHIIHNEDRAGLFGQTILSTISNLNLTNISVVGDSDTEAGGVVGFAQSTAFSNVNVTGSINGKNVGAIAATAVSSTVTNCVINASDFSSVTSTGGVIGFSSAGQVSDCSVEGSLTSDGYAGGVIGYQNVFVTAAFIDQVHNSATVAGEVSTGGLIGYLVSNGATSDAITDSYNTGNVSGSPNCGGLVGYWSASGASTVAISNSYSSGDVNCPGIAGGLIGWATSVMGAFSLTNSFATGDVSSMVDTGSAVGLISHGSGTFTVSNVHWFDSAGNPSVCVGRQTGSPSVSCTDQSSISHFYNSTTNAPLNTWTFPGDWTTQTELPTLSWQ